MKDISILFSGGPDSTLAVLYALQKADRVHLLTYHHRLMSNYKLISNKRKHEVVVRELKEKYGNNRIILYERQIWNLFKKIYYQNIKHDILEYQTFCIPWICGACKLAMHITTIKYNLRNNIKITYDGSNKESASVFPAQSIGYIEVTKKLYESYSMIYENPVYNIEGTDEKTEEFGLKTCKGTKKEHIFFSTQHSCFTGLLLHLHSRLYYRLTKRGNIIREFSPKVLKRKIEEVKQLLPKKIQ